MYLSKIGLDIRAASVRQSMRDCGDMHRNVQKLFSAPRAEESVLYRVYQNETGCFLYTMSENMPRETQDTLHNGMHILGCKDVSAMEVAFIPGRQLRFNLLTMPFKKVYDGVSKNSRRKFLQSPEERAAWLQRKGEQNGFQILSMEELQGNILTSRQKGETMYIPTVRYTGVLCVQDRDAFIHGWKYGIGAEKAYGLGMLLIQ
ncbi:MAG: type I-E CRISPR-associated protein Cas6/Cse3/CasE [Ruminococcaceae bacterium]|nr:type I-E CRISPR-associated protein Cas6/Cse3/CasE [Oscillospiraceae bacterium]